MSLTGTTTRLTAGELAREPRDMGVVAWFDGYGQAAYGRGRAAAMTHPRRLTPSEARCWREGFAEGQRERQRIDAHGFATCASVECTDPRHGAP